MLKIANFKTFGEVRSYIEVSLVAYAIVFVLMYLFVDIVRLNRSVSFLLTYAIAYVFDYFSNLRFVFRQTHSNLRLVKYLIYLVVFFFLANFVFLMTDKLNLHYILATFLTLAIVFPLRFISLRFLVFRHSSSLDSRADKL